MHSNGYKSKTNLDALAGCGPLCRAGRFLSLILGLLPEHLRLELNQLQGISDRVQQWLSVLQATAPLRPKRKETTVCCGIAPAIARTPCLPQLLRLPTYRGLVDLNLLPSPPSVGHGGGNGRPGGSRGDPLAAAFPLLVLCVGAAAAYILRSMLPKFTAPNTAEHTAHASTVVINVKPSTIPNLQVSGRKKNCVPIPGVNGSDLHTISLSFGPLKVVEAQSDPDAGIRRRCSPLGSSHPLIQKCTAPCSATVKM